MKGSRQLLERLVEQGLVSAADVPGPGTAKYRNLATVREIDGAPVRFASRAEARRWDVLEARWRRGEISRPLRQVRWPLNASGRTVSVYVSDFYYVNYLLFVGRGAESCEVVEDVKGHRTEAYRNKARHFAAQYGFSITEIAA